jgi:hypothetical protein
MTITAHAEVDQRRLVSLYAQDAAACALLDHFANRERNQNTSTVRRVTMNLAEDESPLSRGDIIRVFKELESFGCGIFKAGRKGYESRFEWRVSSKSVGQVAAGESSEIEAEVPPAGENADEATEQLVDHSYRLRPSLQLTLALPPDLTAAEAERLARFIMTLPFERRERASRAPAPALLPDEDFSDWEK